MYRKNTKHPFYVTQFANFSFDISIHELSYALVNGYTLHIVPPYIKKSAIDYAYFLIKEHINTIFITTSMLDLLVDALLDIQRQTLMLVKIFVTGEALRINSVMKNFFLKYLITGLHFWGPEFTSITWPMI